jgi:hypothetical protein
MIIQIDSDRFEMAHEAFKQHMLLSSRGVPFVDFQHPFLVSDEIAYKWAVYHKASKLLMLNRWNSWQKHPGKIIQAVKEACKVSENLLEHKYGLQQSSEAALYKVSSIEQTKELEGYLLDIFLGGFSAPTELAHRFDSLADYLRENRLGCRWDFMSYLAFLLRPQLYFPIRSTHFDTLLQFYGIGERISGQVSWARYKFLLDFAEAIKPKLALYGQPNAIEIQSYMWVVSYLIRDGKASDQRPIAEPDFNAELNARAQRAKERERIGLLGEQLVYKKEKSKLIEVGRSDLADRIKPLSFADDRSGYDILSFKPDGTELHIEVKTTARSQDEDNGFWLSGNEKSQAETDSCWTICRVWNIDIAPHYEDIGNIVQNRDGKWELIASTWYVERKNSA